jgi:hypothetical protein
MAQSGLDIAVHGFDGQDFVVSCRAGAGRMKFPVPKLL